MAEKKKATRFERMWLVMRKMSSFTLGDLTQLAEVSNQSAEEYAWRLGRAGYLKKNCATGPGVQWRLIKDTGPKAPRLTTICVICDDNTNERITLERKKII